MMRPSGDELKVYLYRAPIDMRKGRNGLAALAQESMKCDPFSGALFIYVGRRFNALKVLYWGVPRTQERKLRRCCGEDEGRPLGVAFQREAPNRPLLLCPKDTVVNEWERRGRTHVR
jgi:hypothetical protein